MVHTSKNRTLGRKAAPRRALLVNQSGMLLRHKRIVTTLAKAKALARFVAPIITGARIRHRSNPDHAHKQAFANLKHKEPVKILFNDVVPAIGKRPGGYTRIIKMAPRKGDGAPMAMIELVDFNRLYSKSRKATKTRRGRRTKSQNSTMKNPALLPEATHKKEKPPSSQPKVK